MKRFDFKQIILLLCALFTACALTGNSGKKIPPYLEKRACGERHVLWNAQKEENGDLWLLGSIHMADSSFYPLADVVDSSFEASEIVAVEFDILEDTTTAELQNLAQSAGRLPKGVFLKDILPDTLYRTLDSLLNVWEVPIALFEGDRPWSVASSIAVLAFTRSGLSPTLGIDVEMLYRARDYGKKVFSLETPRSQIEIFSSREDSLGIIYLKNTMREIQDLDSMVLGLFSAWKCGDAETLRHFLSAEDDDRTYGEELYTKRNVLMAQKLDSLSSAGKKVFAVVGAAHLVGESPNVLTLLEKKGYRITAR